MIHCRKLHENRIVIQFAKDLPGMILENEQIVLFLRIVKANWIGEKESLLLRVRWKFIGFFSREIELVNYLRNLTFH